MVVPQYCKGPVFIVNFPVAIKSFYMRANDDNRTVAAMDLLVRRICTLYHSLHRSLITVFMCTTHRCPRWVSWWAAACARTATQYCMTK